MAPLVTPAPPRAVIHAWTTVVPLAIAVTLFLAFGAYQLHLPGLHYDEAKEAGLNAMQLLMGQPVTAFRDATLAIGPWRIPLMVQDYIGSLNVVLAVPFLAVGGVNVVALRWLPLILGALTLIVTSRIAHRLGGPLAAAVTALLMAVNPSFVFWSRQGLFVTNITALLFMASLWTGLIWWAERRPRFLYLTAFFAGLGLYAKLSFAWAIGAITLLAAAAWLLERRSARAGYRPRHLHPRRALIALVCFLIPLTPLILFNLQTGGTVASIFGNLGNSYYGVDNRAYLPNLLVRLRQFVDLLRGDHFWYLGHPFANRAAPWLALALAALATAAFLMAKSERRLPLLAPLALLGLMIAQSAFTVSDLFITHFALMAPLLPLLAGAAVGSLALAARDAGVRPLLLGLLGIALALAAVWAAGDAWTTVRYHRVLAISGGYSGHSDAVYELADYLDAQGYRAPVSLDWGIDAPVRFLTQGRVAPVEVFGYAALAAPDRGFAERLQPFFADNDVVYIGHAAPKTVFNGRVSAAESLALASHRVWLQQAYFAQRSGELVFIVYRSMPAP